MTTLLVWRIGALGDTLLTLPALAALRAAFPSHRIVAAGHPESFAPALWAGLADQLLDATSARLAPLLAGTPPLPGALSGDIDLAVVWSAQHEEIACGLARAGIPRIAHAPAVPSDRIPVPTHYLATLAPLGVEPVAYLLQVPGAARAATALAWQRATSAGRDSARSERDQPAGQGVRDNPVVHLHPGAGSPLKRWPLRRYLELARGLRNEGITVIWTAGPADGAVRTELEAAGEAGALVPPLDVAGLATMLERADVCVSADCGVAHLAALLAVPSVVLFGPTDTLLWGPPGPHTTVLHLALPCAPCGEIARACPSRICLRGLPVAAVRCAVQARLRCTDTRAVAGAPAGIRPATAGKTIRAAPPALSEQPCWDYATGDGEPDGVTGGSAPRPAPLRPGAIQSPAPVPGPPGPLQVARWGYLPLVRTWPEQSWTGPA